MIGGQGRAGVRLSCDWRALSDWRAGARPSHDWRAGVGGGEGRARGCRVIAGHGCRAWWGGSRRRVQAEELWEELWH